MGANPEPTPSCYRQNDTTNALNFPHQLYLNRVPAELTSFAFPPTIVARIGVTLAPFNKAIYAPSI